MGKITSFRESGPRYPAIRVIGFLFTLIGAMMMAIGAWLLSQGLYSLAVGGPASPAPNPDPFPGPPVTTAPFPFLLVAKLSLVWAVAFLLSGLQLIALGSFFRLMVHVEENTRASAQMLERLQSRLEATPVGGEAPFRS